MNDFCKYHVSLKKKLIKLLELSFCGKLDPWRIKVTAVVWQEKVK